MYKRKTLRELLARKLTNQIAPFDIEFRADKEMFLRRDPRVFAKKVGKINILVAEN